MEEQKVRNHVQRVPDLRVPGPGPANHSNADIVLRVLARYACQTNRLSRLYDRYYTSST